HRFSAAGLYRHYLAHSCRPAGTRFRNVESVHGIGLWHFRVDNPSQQASTIWHLQPYDYGHLRQPTPFDTTDARGAVSFVSGFSASSGSHSCRCKSSETLQDRGNRPCASIEGSCCGSSAPRPLLQRCFRALRNQPSTERIPPLAPSGSIAMKAPTVPARRWG